MKRMVEVPAMATALVLLMVRLLSLPVAFTRPSMITLSAPFRLIREPAATAPEMLSPVVVG